MTSFLARILKAMRNSSSMIFESWAGVFGALLVGGWLIVAIFAEFVAPYGPYQIFAPLLKPGMSLGVGKVFLLGTDNVGRDILSRLIFGSRTVIFYSVLATGCAYIVGGIMGLIAGYAGGWIDQMLSRLSDIILSFPVLILYVVIILAFGGSGLNIILAVIFASAPGIMRMMRALTLDMKDREFISAALTRGESTLYILFIEILPNLRGILIVDACLRIGYTTITIGVLGFLGLGLPPPMPDWGGMINAGRSVAVFAPHVMLFPALAIASLVVGLNLIADSLREASLKD